MIILLTQSYHRLLFHEENIWLNLRGRGLPLGLHVEELTFPILMVLAVFSFSKKVDFQSDKWQSYYYAAIKEFVVAMYN